VVLGVRDTRDDVFVYPNNPANLVLGQLKNIGAAHGLAYDWKRRHLYVGAYYRSQMGSRFGPGGAGAVYSLDLATGGVEVAARLEAGDPPQEYPPPLFGDAGLPWVGRSSLGDVEIDGDASVLFVVNLFDRHIHRFALPSMRWEGAFEHGAAREAWSANARPFGLGFRDGWLYHGVVDSREDPELPGALSAHVYRSRADGGGMQEVAEVELSYARRPPWVAWKDDELVGDPWMGTGESQPMVGDIEFRPNGDLIVGLLDRLYGAFGDMLPTARVDDGWMIVTTPEHYADEDNIGESAIGTLAAFPGRDWIVGPARMEMGREGGSAGLKWYDNVSGQLSGPHEGLEWISDDLPGIGDVESLCSPVEYPTPTPWPTASATPTVTTTSTASRVRTATASPRATAGRYDIYLPVGVADRCAQRPYVDVVLVLDMSTSMLWQAHNGRPKYVLAQEAAAQFVRLLDLTPDMRGNHDQAAIVGFNVRSWIEQPLTGDGGALHAAIGRLEARIEEGTRLDLALETAREAMTARERRQANRPVVVLLTDGIPNRVPPAEDGRQETTVLRKAEILKATGATVYTIGLGRAEQVAQHLLVQVASSPELYYYAPDAGDLAGIYAQIAGELVCPNPAWP
jgi:Mg-chelatase subunit ChlD